MRSKWVLGFAILVVSLLVMGGTMFAHQDRYTLKVPDGLAFSEFRGYDTWQDVAPSATEGSIKSILANPMMINAYKQGVPANGKSFPDGSKIVKIEWVKQKNPQSPYFVEVPNTLKSLAFIEKDSKRFPDTHGWAYAKWDYEPASGTFKPDALSASGHTCGYTCHTAAKATDYIFTAYPKR
ncbi:MAG TPA: cytochrome P460 family protein [Candidatus Acidoferrum sp.]|nr:cytochrome P460 family protein [Candidatus Acidoferrum sp.]